MNLVQICFSFSGLLTIDIGYASCYPMLSYSLLTIARYDVVYEMMTWWVKSVPFSELSVLTPVIINKHSLLKKI